MADNDPNLEAELEKAERDIRREGENQLFGEHPDGVGPTLGQDLGRPNPGVDIDDEDEEYDPPT